jgi:hypothetical protein
MTRRASKTQTKAPPKARATPEPEAPDSASRVNGIISAAARYETDLEARYVAARDAWTHAMHATNSGRSADMASLAIAQEAYEIVLAERERWLASTRVSVPIEAPDTRHNLEIAVGQELAWRAVHEPPESTGVFARLRRRLRRR